MVLLRQHSARAGQPSHAAVAIEPSARSEPCLIVDGLNHSTTGADSLPPLIVIVWVSIAARFESI